MKSYRKQLGLLAIGAFFTFAPAWAPHIQQLWGRNLFATSDSMVCLGASILVALLCSYLLPDVFVAGARSSVSSFPFPISRNFSIGYKLLAISVLLSLVFILYWINQHILHSFLSSADEHSCYFLAECLRRGKLFVDIPPLADFFKVVHVGMRDGKWFSVYPPGWPLLWAFGLQFNIVDWLNPVLSALSVFFLYKVGSRLFGRSVALLGLAFMIPTPFFMFTSASYFSHSTCLLCISVFLYAFLKWREGYEAGRDPIGWVSLCAFAVGYGLMTRYLTMAAVAGPFLLYHYLPIFFDWKGRSPSPQPSPQGRGMGEGNSWLRFLPFTLKRPRFRKSDWIVIGIIVAFIILILYQNYLVTGKAFRAPNKHDKSWERLGFRKDYTPIDAFVYLIARFFYLADWFPPALIALYLVSLFRAAQQKAVIPERSYRGSSAKDENSGSSLNTCRNDRIMIQTLFRWTFFFIAIAYFFYYSWGGNQWGPRYYYEALPFLCLTAAAYIMRQWEEGGLVRRKFFIGLMIATAISGTFILVKQADYVEESSRQRKALYDLAEQTIKKPAIVFIHGFLGNRLVFAEEDAVRNSPFLDTKILFAHDLGGRNKELMAAYPAREYFRGTYDGVRKQPKLEKIQDEL